MYERLIASSDVRDMIKGGSDVECTITDGGVTGHQPYKDDDDADLNMMAVTRCKLRLRYWQGSQPPGKPGNVREFLLPWKSHGSQGI